MVVQLKILAAVIFGAIFYAAALLVGHRIGIVGLVIVTVTIAVVL